MKSQSTLLKQFHISIVVLLFSLCALAPTRAREPEWKAGAASVKITPDKPIRMSGYASRTEPFEAIEQDLYAKALALEDGTGQRALLISMDLIGIPATIAAEVCNQIEARYGLKRHEVLLSASHTHSGPALSLKSSGDSSQENNGARDTVAYTQTLVEELVSVAGLALEDLGSAQLSWGSGVAHFAVNRREFTRNGVILGVNPRGLVDRTVPVLRIDSANGTPRAVVFSYACHNTTLTGDNHKLCGDYAGFAQAHVERQFPTAQAMFMAGCGGDANPYPRGTVELARKHGTELGQEICRVLGTDLNPVNGPLIPTYDHVLLPLQKHSREQLEELANSGPGLHRSTARNILAKMDEGVKISDTYRAPVAVWQFGKDLTLVALPSEAVVDYVWLLEKALGPLQLWVTAYCNDYFGYLPTPRILGEGGYETRGLFSGDGWFAKETAEILVQKARELAVKAGRSVPSRAE